MKRLVPAILTAVMLLTFILASCEGYQVDTDFVPEITLITPSDGDTFMVNDSIVFRCYAHDPGVGSLSGQSVEWTSDKDGHIGYGTECAKKGFSANTHTIQIVATDSMNNTGRLTFTLIIL